MPKIKAVRSPQIRRTVMTKPWTFILTFEDGREEEATVSAESFSAAILSLPRFADVGKYKYRVVSKNELSEHR